MQKFRKAYTAAGAVFAGALGKTLSDGNLTVTEFLTSLGAALVVGAAVYQVKNAG